MFGKPAPNAKVVYLYKLTNEGAIFVHARASLKPGATIAGGGEGAPWAPPRPRL
jgi:hypothetical protein